MPLWCRWIFGAGCLLVLVAAVGFWVRSWRCCDVVYFTMLDHSYVAASFAGAVVVGRQRIVNGTPGWKYYKDDIDTVAKEDTHPWWFYGSGDPDALILSIPDWVIVAGAAGGLLVCCRRRGYGEGRCSQCGYDIRSCVDRCSECGTVLMREGAKR